MHKNKSAFYYMYGRHSVIAALNNPRRYIEKVFCSQAVFDKDKKLISNFKYEIGTTIFLTKILGQDQNHQGIVAKVAPIFSNNINDVNFTKENCRIVVLDQITDSQNIGAIIRSAVGFGIDAIIMPNDNSPEENSTIAKVASGTLELIKIIKVTNLRSTMEYLKKAGFWIIGLDSNAKESINKQLFSNKIVIALGAEDHGLRRLTKETCDYMVKIPISPQVESLNVANSATIAFYLSCPY